MQCRKYVHCCKLTVLYIQRYAYQAAPNLPSQKDGVFEFSRHLWTGFAQKRRENLKTSNVTSLYFALHAICVSLHIKKLLLLVQTTEIRTESTESKRWGV
jgi:hypothetical protein